MSATTRCNASTTMYARHDEVPEDYTEALAAGDAAVGAYWVRWIKRVHKAQVDDRTPFERSHARY